MVQPQYSPQEALEKIKLMMKYDTSKTLNENFEVIKETIKESRQTILEADEECTNSISYEELLEYVEQAEEAHDDIFNWAGSKDISDSYEDAKDIYDALKAVSGKNIYDEEQGKCVPAISFFKTKYREINKEDWVGGNSSLEEDISDILKRNIGAESNRYCRLALQILNKPLVDTEKKTDDSNKKTDDGKSEWDKLKDTSKGGGAKSGYKPCSGTYSFGCKSDVIAKVQGCLGGLVTDGKFGPKTKAKLAGKGFSSFTDADVDKICQTAVVKPQDEFTTQVDADEPEDILNT